MGGTATSPTTVVTARPARQAEEPPPRRTGLRCASTAVVAATAAADAATPAAPVRADATATAAAAAAAASDPPWLPAFILTPFYDACPVHSPRHRSERNRYDVATGAKLCQYCAAERARSGGGDGRPLIQLCRVRTEGQGPAGRQAGVGGVERVGRWCLFLLVFLAIARWPAGVYALGECILTWCPFALTCRVRVV